MVFLFVGIVRAWALTRSLGMRAARLSGGLPTLAMAGGARTVCLRLPLSTSIFRAVVCCEYRPAIRTHLVTHAGERSFE